MRYLVKASFLFIIGMSALVQADENFQPIITAHQKMLVLLDSAAELDPLDPHIHSARNFYVQKREHIEQIVEAAEAESIDTPNRQRLPTTDAFIAFYLDTDTLQEGDRLALADVAEELLLLEEERRVPAQGLTRLKRVNADITRIQDKFRDEYTKLLGKLGKTRGSESDWQVYIDGLKARYPSQTILNEGLDSKELHREKSRGANLAKDKKDRMTGALAPIIWGNGLPEKTVVLTFDDGPHRLRTAKILDILKEYDVNGYFFAVGKNLGSTKDGVKLSKRNRKVIQRIVDEGHILANHSFSHLELTKLDKKTKSSELSKTNQLIRASTGFDNYLFRPPYGSKNAEVEAIAKEQGLSSIMWNLDSMDWADPIPESINERVFERLEKKKRGIILFHDIHKQTVAALPGLLKGLAERGYRVVTLDGEPFSLGKTGVPRLPQAKEPELYKNSWAVVIGINAYQHWPTLDYAVSDAQSIAKKLHQNFGFEKERIIEIYDEDATREKIVETLGYTLADPKRISPEDRVFIFYAGHGATRQLPNGKHLGYLIPADAELEKFQTQGISMSVLNDFSSLIPAKHVYFVMDSCYSGLALTRAGGKQTSYNYLQHITSRFARQIITAGGADQEVADGGPGGHSVFTWTLLQALDGKADTDDNGYITASEIGTYVSPVVASYAPQTPAFGNLVGSQGGDFVFKLSQGAAERAKDQQAQQQLQQVAALTAAKNDLTENVERQLELDKTRSNETKVVDKTAVSQSLQSNARVQAANQADARALKLFRNGQLDAAEKAWAEAVKLNPYNVNIVNNYGYVLDKLGRNDEALIWYYRTIELDPKRTPIYLNLGDMMVKLNKPALAIPYYERYLHLYPSYAKADDLRKHMDALRKQVENDQT